MPRPKSSRYRLNQRIRRMLKHIMRAISARAREKRFAVDAENIRKILLVRATFRMGDSILATPAISLFRDRFPHAQIHFVGGPISQDLFRNLPLDQQFVITRRFPHAAWAYSVLVRRLRRERYDLAVELSVSQSAMGAFIVGFSGARFRIGLKGEWDRWFNVRIPRPSERNKYRILPALLRFLNFKGTETAPVIVLSAIEREKGKARIASLLQRKPGLVVGVFVGGRTTWAKRWPPENFCRVISHLQKEGAHVVSFFGPDEKTLVEYFSSCLGPGTPLIYEPSPRAFAAMVAACDLFLTCDSGPMHLACALRTRTIAIFQHANFDHWGPPASLGRIVYERAGSNPDQVLAACRAELSKMKQKVS